MFPDRLFCCRACNFKYVAIEWDKPRCYGDAKVTGYKVYVNGVVEAILAADQQTYSFTHGRWCREYAFQVQVRGDCMDVAGPDPGDLPVCHTNCG